MGEILGDCWTCDVVNLDCKYADACPLITECKVDTFLGYGNAFYFSIDVDIRILIETPFTGSNAS